MIEVLRENPLTIKVSANARELDFNRISVQTLRNRAYTLDYDQRTGFDASTNANLDRETTDDDVTIIPDRFSSASFRNNRPYQSVFVFNRLNSYRFIIASDIWGNENLVNNLNAPPVGTLAIPPVNFLLQEGEP